MIYLFIIAPFKSLNDENIVHADEFVSLQRKTC